MLNAQEETGCSNNFHQGPIQALVDWIFTRHARSVHGLFLGDSVRSNVNSTSPLDWDSPGFHPLALKTVLVCVICHTVPQFR